jgi:hypothetical protein
MLRIGPLSPVEFKYVSGHIEGIQGRTVFKDAPQSYSQSTVLIDKAVKRDVRRTLAGLSAEYYGIYQEYECPEFDLRSVSESHRRIVYVWPGRD